MVPDVTLILVIFLQASGSADKPESEKTILDKAMDKINGANDTVQENLNLAS